MKRKIIFPAVETADKDGLVALGGDLEIDTILEAYRSGIFPWPVYSNEDGKSLPITWFSPNPRGVLDFKDVHIPRSFNKFLKTTPYQVTFNKNFSHVILQCAQTIRKDKSGTWITPEIIDSYINLFNAGYAYSVEVWHEKHIIAGIYGVVIGEFVSGESMFTHENNASKQGLYQLIHHLEKKGLTWIDTQMVTPVVSQFGGKYINRTDFIDRLEKLSWNKNRNDLF